MKSESRDARAKLRLQAELEKLRERDFVVVHGCDQTGEGVRDHLVSGPTGVFYVVTRRNGLDDEQLREAWRRAEELCQELDTWVTPVICAPSRGKPHRQERVWIVPNKRIVDWIAGRRNPVLASERAARLAERPRTSDSTTPTSIDISSVSTALLERARADRAYAETEGDGARQIKSEQTEPA
ncbi:MAG: hypothetical protein ABSC51_10235 [Gaiellaceae bacterium]|jgi:hypothetical protein